LEGLNVVPDISVFLPEGAFNFKFALPQRELAAERVLRMEDWSGDIGVAGRSAVAAGGFEV